MSNPFISTERVFSGIPFYPIIILRGYAMRASDIEQAVNEPFSGFEKGSTKYRQESDGSIAPYYFESPVLRLVTDYGFEDAYRNGQEPSDPDKLGEFDHPEKTIWVYRYYEQASNDFGDGERDEIQVLADGLDVMIERLRKLYGELGDQIGVDFRSHFKVHLVAHSMGGLVVRSYIQKVYPDKVVGGERAVPVPVDKVFTYGTPHNGIEVRGIGNHINIGLFDISNFSRKKMRGFLGLPQTGDPHADVNDLDGKFDPKRLFCLIGTNERDYDVPVSTAAVGPLSDGLVRIANAWVKGSPRAHIHRAHGGPFGMVNSEDGYQNLQRFLFGNTRIDGSLELNGIELPRKITEYRQEGREINANFYFDNIVSVRGSFGWNLSRRKVEEDSSVWREYNVLFEGSDGFKKQELNLFSTFLDSRKIVKNIDSGHKPSYMAFAVDLTFMVDRFKVDRKLWFDASFDGLTFLQERLIIEVMQDDGAEIGWKLRYSFKSAELGFSTAEGQVTAGGVEFRIPIVNNTRPGVDSQLVLRASAWE